METGDTLLCGGREVLAKYITLYIVQRKPFFQILYKYNINHVSSLLKRKHAFEILRVQLQVAVKSESWTDCCMDMSQRAKEATQSSAAG